MSKIIDLLKEKAKANKKEISKNEAEKILKDSQNQTNKENLETKIKTKSSPKSKTITKKTSKTSSKSKVSAKKVSKK